MTVHTTMHLCATHCYHAWSSNMMVIQHQVETICKCKGRFQVRNAATITPQLGLTRITLFRTYLQHFLQWRTVFEWIESLPSQPDTMGSVAILSVFALLLYTMR